MHYAVVMFNLMDQTGPVALNSPYPEVLLSARVMLEQYGSDLGAVLQKTNPAASLTLPSLTVLWKLMLDEGWCIHHLRQLFATESAIALTQLCSLDRSHSRRAAHTHCLSSETCVGDNVAMEGFTGHHTSAGCECDHVPAPENAMLDMLESGHVPLLCVQRINRRFRLSYTRMRPQLNFVAISHLWADGLGNTEAHAIPNCQLERILEYATSIERVRRKRSNWPPQFMRRPLANCIMHESTQVFLWLDVYCVPLTRNGNLAGLKLQAMGQMPFVYNSASSVLILDKELEANDPDIGKDLELWLRVSAYYRRYWTPQEAALAGLSGLYAVCGERIVRVARSVEVHIPRYSGSDVKGSELIRVIFYALLERTLDQSDPRSYRSLRLVEVWNSLLGKTSTKRGELHAILANLLDISATTVLSLSPTDRIKAILHNYQRLPLDMIFSASSRVSEITNSDGHAPKLPDDRDRWLPHFPGGTPITLYRSGVGVDTHAWLNDDLLIPSTLPRLRLFKECSDLPQQGPFVLAQYNIWAEFTQPQGYTPPRASGPAYYLLHAHSEPATFASRGYQGNGARLILQKVTEGCHEQRRYSFIFDRPLVFGTLDARSQELGGAAAEIVVEEVKDRPSIIFECDAHQWPKAPFVRDFVSTRRRSYLALPFFGAIVCLALGASFGGGLGFKVWAKSSAENRRNPVFWVLLVFVYLFSMGFLSRSLSMVIEHQIHTFIWADSFRRNYEPNRPWVVRLDKAIRQAGPPTWRTLALRASLRPLIWFLEHATDFEQDPVPDWRSP
ncbi:hypothetical protein LTR15_003965 [Elasticomyces elasticus]|nr:hypothetical protein LTR15_003965 [Elasticomyces elasticus]